MDNERGCPGTNEAENGGANVADISVEVATVDAILDKLCRKYSRRRQRDRKKEKKKRDPLWNLQNLAILIIVVIFIIVVIMWSLLWIFIFRRESGSGAYFAGMFQVANVEFIPEYRHTGSSEFLSMANRIQYVVSSVYKKSSISRLYRHSVITDLRHVQPVPALYALFLLWCSASQGMGCAVTMLTI
ncbi:hypothetical protein COCON_G00063810 [Conger conger]|uniref:SEA domain-containing protein n=1 Tax=Conger conger TaxID=82655 RepID=A0A9Q1DRU7_CONCO|nr:transmembrane protease serine 7-like [Conger conger]KAJ8279315.1 hypothetical protein COCON_G00063810 [Conger conger]